MSKSKVGKKSVKVEYRSFRQAVQHVGRLVRDNASEFSFSLGLGRKTAKYTSFQEARKFVRSLGLKSVDGWTSYRKSGKKPNGIPSVPDRAYEGKGWMSWGDWLGTRRSASVV